MAFQIAASIGLQKVFMEAHPILLVSGSGGASSTGTAVSDGPRPGGEQERSAAIYGDHARPIEQHAGA